MSSRCPGTAKRDAGFPIISAAVYPKMRSAPLFQLVTMPSKSLLTMASSEDSIMAARERNRYSLSRSACSAALRSVISTIADSTIGPSSVSTGFNPISIGNSLPSFLRP